MSEQNAAQTPVAVEPTQVSMPETPAVAPRYRNEGRDVLGEALSDPTKQAISGETGTYFEPVVPVVHQTTQVETQQSQAEQTPTQVVETPTVQTQTQEPTKTGPTVTERLFAGKFKTVEELEASYKEAERQFHVKTQEAAAAKKLAEANKTPEQISQEAASRKAELVNSLLEDPEKVIREVQEQARIQQEQALAVQRAVEDWKKANPDVAQYERFVGTEMASLSAANPELASDGAALLAQATTNIRQLVQTIREAGKAEALSVRNSTTPLSQAKVQVPPPTEQPVKAPMTQQEAVDAHMQFLKEQSVRVRTVKR
jgi:hypothetical protein